LLILKDARESAYVCQVNFFLTIGPSSLNIFYEFVNWNNQLKLFFSNINSNNYSILATCITAGDVADNAQSPGDVVTSLLL